MVFALPQDITISVAVNPDQIPDEAEPVCGRIVMPWLENAELTLDGNSLGPFALSNNADLSSGSDEHDCILSSVQIHPEPQGLYFYQPKDPSPLQERWRKNSTWVGCTPMALRRFFKGSAS